MPASRSEEAVNFWNTIMSKGPDSISGGDMPALGTTIDTWIRAMIKEADFIRGSMINLMPYMKNTFKETWGLGGGVSTTVTAPPSSGSLPPIPPSLPLPHPPLPAPSSSTSPGSGGGGGGGKGAGVGKKEDKPRPVFHCQACGRKDAFHRDGSTCPALLRGGEYANPDWRNTIWEESPQGKAARAKNFSFAYPPRSKFMKIDGMRGSGELFEFSYLNNIGRGCSTSISFLTIPNTTNLSPTNFIQNMSRMVSRSLIDTGADLSFISSTKARGLLRRGIGKLDKGRYKVVDAFLKGHFFSESLTVDLVFGELIKLMLSETCFTIKLVIVDIPLNSEVIIGLADIRRLRIFDLLPHLVRQEATGQGGKRERGLSC
jgi:hypothetical protein